MVECRKITQRAPERLSQNECKWISSTQRAGAFDEGHGDRSELVALSQSRLDHLPRAVGWRIGYGDLQDAKWHDYYKVNLR